MDRQVRPEKKGGGQQGNANGIALKDSNVRLEAYRQYCAHIAKGKSKRSWFFDHPTFSCCWKTMEKYLENQVEFPPIHKEIAMAQGYAVWEEVVDQSARGENKANTASLQMLMRNKFGWDRNKEKDVDDLVNADAHSSLKQMAEAIENGIKCVPSSQNVGKY